MAFLSLSGIPPFTGFFAKFFLLIETYKIQPVLVIIALFSSIVGAFLYVRFILLAFTKDSEAVKVPISTLHVIVLLFCALALLFGWTMIMV
jgi:NADH-quinone oxidoreductase subunit N